MTGRGWSRARGAGGVTKGSGVRVRDEVTASWAFTSAPFRRRSRILAVSPSEAAVMIWVEEGRSRVYKGVREGAERESGSHGAG